MIERIVSSSILILLVLAVRALAKSRLSCRARYALWLLVLVRLLVPVQLFTASWGVAEVNVPDPVVAYRLPRDYAAPDPTPTEPAPMPEAAEPPQGRGADAEALMTARAADRAAHYAAVNASDVLRAVWLTGAGVMAVVLLVSNLRFARRLRRERAPYDALVGGMRVYVAEGIASPCLVGVFRPTVYLTPECTRDERTLRHVLAHETTHRLHGDCVWSLLRLAALCLHWYNPLVWYAVVVSKRDGELACDEATLQRLGEDERVAYGETLLSMVTAKPRGRDLLSASTAMTAGKKPMRERIETIARHPRTKAAALVLALTVLLTATVFAFSKAEAREPEDEPREQPETEQRVETSTPDAVEVLRVTDSYEVAARRYIGVGWSVCVPVEGWRGTSGGDTVRWTSDAGSTLSVKWLASRDDCDLAPYMEHWDWTSDELNTVIYEDTPNHLRMEARLYAAPSGGYWQVLTQYDTGLRLYSSWTGLEPLLLEAMAESFTVDDSVYAKPPAGYVRYNGEGWYIYVPEDWNTYWTSGFDPEEVAGYILFRATGSGDWQGEGLSVFTMRHSAEEELRDQEQRGHTVDWANRAAESGTGHTRVYDAPNGGCHVVSWQDPTGRYDDVLRVMAESFTVDESVTQNAEYPDMRQPFENEAAFFESIAGEYWFLSGAGGWRTELTIAANGDGTFTGEYSSGSGYCGFSGHFGEVRRANEYAWSMRLTELTSETEPGAEVWVDGRRKTGASPYGLEGADEVLVYLPGTPVDALPEEFIQWYCAGLSFGRSQIGSTLPTVGLYNVNEQYGWFARSLIEDGWEPLPADELAAWTEALRTFEDEGDSAIRLVSCFFTSYYGTPRDINLYDFLYQCPLRELMNISDGTAAEAEFDALKAAAGDRYYGASAPTWRYRVADINAALTQYAGITLDDMATDWRNDGRMLYLPEYDSFYNFTSDFGPGAFVPERGEHLGSVVRLYGNYAALQVSGTPDSFRIMSFTER